MSQQNHILLIDPSFSDEQSVNCDLLIKSGIDSFSYIVLDKEQKRVLIIYDEQASPNGPEKLESKLKEDHYLNLSYRSVKFSCHSEQVLLLPDELQPEINPAQLSAYFTNAANGNIYYNPQEGFGCTAYFAFPRTIEDMLKKKWPECQVFSPDSSLVKLAQAADNTAMFLDFTAGSFQVLWLRDAKIIFRQVFEIANSEELQYFLHLFSHSLGLNHKETPLYLSGIIHENDAYFNVIKALFEKIHFLNHSYYHEYSGLLEDMPAHYYSNLLALEQCE